MNQRKKSKVFAFGEGQWARHKTTGANVIVTGAQRSPIGLLVVARVTSKGRKGRRIVAKATSFASRAGGPTPTPLTVAA